MYFTDIKWWQNYAILEFEIRFFITWENICINVKLCHTRPQSHGIDGIVSISGNWTIIRHGIEDLIIDPLANTVLLHRTTVEIHGQHVFGASLLPRIAESKPIVGLLALPTVLDLLREYTIIISQTISIRRQTYIKKHMLLTNLHINKSNYLDFIIFVF